MARRANTKLNPLKVFFIIFIIIIVFIVGFIFFKNSNDKFRNMKPLNVKEYMQNSRSLSGNTLFVKARINEKIRWEPNKGALWSMESRDADDKKQEILPVFIPSSFDHLNLQVGQKVKLKVRIDRNGLLISDDIIKL